MKCGSTSLVEGLNTHPEVFVSKQSPPRFFHVEKYRKKEFNYYCKFFDGRKEKVLSDDKGMYSWDSFCSKTPERIKRHLPRVKILYIIRHPVRRIESHWGWAVANGQPWGTINEAVQSVDRLIEMSLYWRQISRYRTHFDDDQINVLFLENLKADPRTLFRDFGRFLGVDPDGFDFEEAATPKNQTADRRTDTRLAQRLRQWSGFWTLKEMIPDPIVHLGERMLRRDGKIEPDWDPDVRRRVEERLAPDTAKMLDYCCRSRNLWTFETVSISDCLSLPDR
ncbi:sulfotransferase [Salinibacter ruber]